MPQKPTTISHMLVCDHCQTQNSPYNPQCKSCGKDLPLVCAGTTGQPVKQHANPAPLRLLPTGENLPWSTGRYVLEKCIRQTRHAEVYRARDAVMRRALAIKAHLQAEADRDRPDFLKEARALAALNHPHIAQVYDCTQLNHVPCLVLEWVQGAALNPKHFATHSAFTQLIRQIFSALESAHQAGLIHRDLKPDHVMVTPAGQIKIIDFGLVKRYGSAVDSLPSTPQDIFWRGTPAYMSPEQIAGIKIDWRSDMFSLAITLVEAMCGTHPFAHKNMAILLHNISHQEPALNRLDQPWLDDGMRRAFQKALAKDPDQRFASWSAFAYALGI